MKTIFFMAGLPRSGATLLSSILNQNPNLYVSPQTDLLWQMTMLHKNMLQSETYQLGQLHAGYTNVLSKLPQNFYEHIDPPVIIDKNRSWGTPDNIKLAAMVNSNIKIIAPYRSLIEVLASFIRQCESNPGKNYIDKNIANTNYMHNKSINDARCEWLIDNELKHNIESLKYIKLNKLGLLIEYNEIVFNTKNVIDSIYDYLNIELYEHNLLKIISTESYKDLEVYGLPNLHNVRQIIAKEQYDINDYVSLFIQNKYKGLL